MNSDPESRLDRLEAQLRRQRWFSLLSLILAAVAVAWGWQGRAITISRGTTVEAERFILKDAKGQERGVWEVDAKNLTQFRLQTGGANRLFLGETGTGTGLTVWNGSNAKASLDADANGAKVTLTDKDNLFCQMNTAGNQFILQSAVGRVDMDAGKSPQGAPWMQFSKGGKTRVGLGNGFVTGGVWRLRFLNPDGTTAFHETPPTAPPN
ncbi:MAG: hypothetical protein JNM99_16900 [Verrucomicrobiaceae bacterium]|nr:hypothetical protein [Verrucomicrobiaceae bacterium]